MKKPLLCWIITCLAGLSVAAVAGSVDNYLSVQNADIAAPKMSGGVPDQTFLNQHEAFLKRAQSGPIDLLFIGDSITARWPGNSSWKEYYGSYNVANFGISGDRTQHVLWRVEHGELDGVSPKVVVLLIGTNNIPVANSVKEITHGVQEIVQDIHQKLPNSHLLLVAIFPRGTNAQDIQTIQNRSRINAVNAMLARLPLGKNDRYMDIGRGFLDANGNIPISIMPDGLHPNDNGYRLWAEALRPVLQEMMAP